MRLRSSSVLIRPSKSVATAVALLLVIAGLVAFAPTSRAVGAALPSVSAEHPRILATAASFAKLQRQIGTDGTTGTLYKAVKKEADSYLSAPVVTYSKPDGIRLTATSQTTVKHVLALAMMWRITGAQQYAARLWQDLDAVSKFPDWNPDQFLDTAEMTAAVSIAYDWMYDKWNSAQKAELLNAIVSKGLAPSLPVYQAAPTSGGPYKYGGNWSQQSGNWNIVVNSGMAIGALAVYDARPDIAKPVLGDALASIQKGVATYANGGGWPEGLGYWEYSTRYLTILVQSLESATGSDQGLLSKPGVADTGYFPLYLSSPNGATTFAYGDSAVAPYLSSAVGALGTLLQNPVLEAAGEAQNVYGSNVQRLLSADPSMGSATPASADLPLDKVFPNAGATAFRSSWTDPNATFVGFRSSNTPSAAHQNLDAGSFSLGALGQTWGEELGKEDYNLSGYFDSGVDGARWTYYRERAEGQNTLVIDPDDPDSISTTAQVPAATFVTNGTNGQSIANLSALYPSDVQSWKRGVKTFDGGTETVVQDEITTATSVDALWTMHTQADIRISTDGKTALLYRNGRELAARITAGAGTFTSGASVPYATSPSPTQTANTGMNTLNVQFTSTGTTTLAVEFTPVTDPSAALPAAAPVAPLATWKPDASASRGTSPVGTATAPAAPQRLAAASITSAPTSANVGTTATIIARGTDASGNTVPGTTTRFVSSDPAVATVDQFGNVTPKAAGSVRVGAVLTANRSVAYAGTTITVVDPTLVHVGTDVDTYAQAGTSANTNYGSATLLLVKPHRTGVAANELTRVALIHFSLPQLVGKKVTRATVSIRGKVSDTNGSTVQVDAHLITSRWNGSTLTYANMPKISSGTIASATYGSSAAVQTFDVTDFVNSSAFTGAFTLAMTENAPPNGQPLLVQMFSMESGKGAVLDATIAR